MRYLIFISLFFSIISCKQIKSKNFLVVEHLNGKVKNVSESFYPMEMQDGELKKGNIWFKTCYTIDKSGNRTEWKEYQGNGQLKWIAVSNYKEGREIECLGKKENGDPDWKAIYTYDENGNKVEEKDMTASGKQDYRIVFKFDTKGNKIERFFYDANESLSSRSEYKYDSNGNLFEEDVYAPTGELKSESRSKYENIDNQGNWLSQTVYSNGQPSMISERVIEYY